MYLKFPLKHAIHKNFFCNHVFYLYLFSVGILDWNKGNFSRPFTRSRNFYVLYKNAIRSGYLDVWGQDFWNQCIRINFQVVECLKFNHLQTYSSQKMWVCMKYLILNVRLILKRMRKTIYSKQKFKNPAFLFSHSVRNTKIIPTTK